MNDDACRGRREDIGAFVLGMLDDRRSTALMAHLDGCPSCREEAEELAAVARLLPLADPLRAGEQPLPPKGLSDSIVERVRSEERVARRQRIGRVSAVGLGIAAAAIALVAYLALTGPDIVEVDLASGTTQGQSHASLEYLPGGTRVTLSVDGLPMEETFGVWLEKQDGDRVPAGSFYTPEDGEIELTMTAAIRLKDCGGIGISNADGDTVLYASLD